MPAPADGEREAAASREEAAAGGAAVQPGVSGRHKWSEIRHKRAGLPTLDVLIPSVFSRHDLLVRLLDHLRPQLAPFMGNARVLVLRDDARAAIGSKRNQLMLAATADYVAYLDDDDWVHDDYVGRIMEALVRRPDTVGWKLAYTVDGNPQKPAVHSLTNDGWGETDDLYLRTLSHLNPLRRELALLGLPFQPGFGEDKAWADRVMATGLVKTEVFIEGAAMYEYRYSSQTSLFAGGPKHTNEPAPPLPDYPYVRLLGENG